MLTRKCARDIAYCVSDNNTTINSYNQTHRVMCQCTLAFVNELTAYLLALRFVKKNNFYNTFLTFVQIDDFHVDNHIVKSEKGKN